MEKPTPTTVVIEPGAEPRQRLSYDLPDGLVEEIETTTKLRIDNQFTNTVLEKGHTAVDLPAIVIHARLQVTGHSSKGEALVSYDVEDARRIDDLVDPSVRQLTDAAARELKNAHSTLRLTPTGEVDDVQSELPNAPHAGRDRITELSDSWRDSFVRFPDAAIGVGAVWQVESQVTTSGVTWTRKATYTLHDATNGQAVVDFSVSSRASEQALSVEPNASTKLTSGTGTGSGQAIVPRRGFVISGSTDGTAEMNLLIVQQHLRISSTVRTQVIGSVKRIDSSASSAPDNAPP